MNNRVINENKRLLSALKLRPEVKVMKRLGGGNKGEAYLLGDGKVLKITIDKEEFSTAMTLKNRKLEHIIDIYEGWNFLCVYDEEYSDNLSAIIEEFLDTTSKKEMVVKFVSIFKHAWFSIYFSEIEKLSMATFEDLDRCMRNPNKYSEAINFTKEYINNEGNKFGLGKEFDEFYDTIQNFV